MGFGQILLVQLARNLGNTKLNDCIYPESDKPIDMMAAS